MPLLMISKSNNSQLNKKNRVLSISDNWEKVWEKLLNSHLKEQHLPDNVNYVNCRESIATT